MSETETALRTPVRPASRPVRVCILGSVNAGKTTFLGGLGILREPNRHTPFRITPMDEPSAAYLDDKAAQLRAGQWPGPSTIAELVRLQVVIDHTAMEILVLDYPGGNFTDALAALRANEAQELQHFVREAEILLLLLDPAFDLGLGESAEVLTRQQAFLTTLAHLQITQQRDAARPSRSTRWSAIVLTKCDRYPQLAGHRAARRFVTQQAGAFGAKLAEYSTKLAYFVISAVGATRTNDVDPDHPLPAKQLEPMGYEALFRWIRRKRLRDRYRPWVTLGLALLGIGAMVGAAATLMVSESSRYQLARFKTFMDQEQTLPPPLGWFPAPEVRQAFNALVEQRLHKAAGEIPQAPNAAALKRVDEMLHALEARRDLDPVQRGRATQLRGNVSQREEALSFRDIDDARDKPHEIVLIDSHLQRWRDGIHTGQLRERRQRALERQQHQKRDTIKAITVRDKYGYDQKKQAILEYLKDYRDDPERENLQRAVELATLLGQGQTWHVTLVSAGAFASARWHQVEIWTRGAQPQHTFDALSATTLSTYNREFLLHWQPGQRVKLALIGAKYAGLIYTGKEEAAAFERDDVASIFLLHGKHSLNPGPDWRHDFATEGPYIHCRVREFQEGDAAIVYDYLVPGSKW